MKKPIVAILSFLSMFFLATGSVVLSCSTTQTAKTGNRDSKIAVNTEPVQDGRLYTTWIFEKIQSVIIVDESDRSRKIELAPVEWEYNPTTTELSILREIPFKDYIARIEGFPSLPHSFVLNEIKDASDLMVIIRDRLAIEGYDYTFDAKGNRLTFRNDVNLKESDWSIHYSTPYGAAMLGEWKPENADRMSYIEAEHRKRWLDSWYDRQTAFWFFDDTRMNEWKTNPDQPPSLIYRAATMKELADMKSVPVNVIKFRTEAKDQDLSHELGFNARVPRSLGTKSPLMEFPLAWKTIEEYSKSGNLVKRLNIVYEDDSKKGLEQYIISITMEGNTNDLSGPTEDEWLISEETIDLGLPVHVVRQWGMQVSDLESKPTVVKFTTWTWTEGSIHCQANSDSEHDTLSAELLREFIAARMKNE